MPFDRFSIEQLAGDLLPSPTQEQKIATGFNRNAPTNVEAGSDPEETRVNQVLDRVNTLGMVWLGTTLEYAQCHDHEYDPFTQKDYYRLFAYFNSTVIEAERSNPKAPGSIRFLGPDLALIDPSANASRAALRREISELNQKLASLAKRFEESDETWETALRNRAKDAPREHVLAVSGFESLGGATHEVLNDGSVLVSGDPPDKDTLTVKTRLTGIHAIKLETLTDPSLPGKGPGRGDANRPNFVLNTFAMSVAKQGNKPKPVRFKSARADFSQANMPVAGAIDTDSKTARAINPQFHKPHWAQFETEAEIGDAGGVELTFTMVQNYGGGRTIGRFRLSAVTGNQNGATLPAAVAEALALTPEKRSAVHKKALLDFRLSQDSEYIRLLGAIRSREAEFAKIPTNKTQIMQELSTPRPTRIFLRGEFRTPGEAVEPGTPAVLHALDAKAERNRLGLARWLFSRDNPLTARVTVNRIWGELFGNGIVATPEDFGIKGDPPSHPELLDWLAIEFMEPTGKTAPWSMKHTIRTIVLSSTYRQSTRCSPRVRERDPDNRLLARGARFRLDAEGIRDNALSISGLLSTRLGGAPIRPPQPEGLWIKVGGERSGNRYPHRPVRAGL